MSAVSAGSGRPRVAWREAEVRRVVPETAEAVTLVLDVPGWPGHRAGQHVDVRLTAEDGYQAQRSYSIAFRAGAAGARADRRAARRRRGVPVLVDVVRAGDQFELRGPIGGWFTWDAPQGGPLLLIAGGSGLVPLMAMLRHRQLAGSDAEARLLLSTRSPGDVLYARELEAIAADPGVTVVHTYTRSRPEGWTGFARRVDRAMLEEVAWPPADRPQAFVCGPTAFVEAVADGLVALGHDPDRIRTERFGATGG